jgi:hypothetical protein
MRGCQAAGAKTDGILLKQACRSAPVSSSAAAQADLTVDDLETPLVITPDMILVDGEGHQLTIPERVVPLFERLNRK